MLQDMEITLRNQKIFSDPFENSFCWNSQVQRKFRHPWAEK